MLKNPNGTTKLWEEVSAIHSQAQTKVLYTIQIDGVAEEILQLEIHVNRNGTTEIDFLLYKEEKNAGNTTIASTRGCNRSRCWW